MKRFLAIICWMLLTAPAYAQQVPLLAHATIHTQNKAESFTLEVAHTPETRKFGLMNRRHIGQFQGMIFLFPKAHDYEFWMANTYIPLDMIFVNTDNKIVRIVSNVEPLSKWGRSAKTEVDKVIELSGGTANALGIQVGDRVEYTLSQYVTAE